MIISLSRMSSQVIVVSLFSKIYLLIFCLNCEGRFQCQHFSFLLDSFSEITFISLSSYFEYRCLHHNRQTKSSNWYLCSKSSSWISNGCEIRRSPERIARRMTMANVIFGHRQKFLNLALKVFVCTNLN